jgi:hypothetical protein
MEAIEMKRIDQKGKKLNKKGKCTVVDLRIQYHDI